MGVMFSRTAFLFFSKTFGKVISQKYLATSEVYLETEADFIIFKYFNYNCLQSYLPADNLFNFPVQFFNTERIFFSVFSYKNLKHWFKVSSHILKFIYH